MTVPITDTERVTLLRGAIPEQPFFGCCDSSCYDCSNHPSHFGHCAYAALTEADRTADAASMTSAERAATIARLQAAVPEYPTFGMCFTACMFCSDGDPDHDDDCGWTVAQRAGLLPAD